MSFRATLLFSVLCSLVATCWGTYIVTCHNNNECGTVCGYYSSDMVAPTEGLFGTSCKCQSGKTTYRCTAMGYTVNVCSDYKAPSCSTACGQQICITKDNKKTTGKILSACPKNHPVNTQQCCEHPTSKDYCTCVIQDTLDLNASPYSALGNSNGYASSAVWGSCSSQLASLEININSTRANELVKPFLKEGLWCPTHESKEYEVKFLTECNGLEKDQCSSKPGCKYCNSNKKEIKSDCYNENEAEVLTHVLTVENGPRAFVCDV